MSIHTVALFLPLIAASFQNGISLQRNPHEVVKTKVKQGETLYKKYRCISCHGKTGKKRGDLTGAFKKYDDEELKKYIMNPRDFGNTKMPVYRDVIREEEYLPLVAYINWLGERA